MMRDAGAGLRAAGEEHDVSVTTSDWRGDIVAGLKANDVRLIAHVSDSVLAPIVRLIEADDFFSVVTLTREEEGVGLLTGAYLGGMRGALLLQSSGLGNTINAFGSLALPYQIPFVVLLSQRGGFYEHNVVQLAGGKATPRILDALGIQVFEMLEPADAGFMTERGARHAFVTRRPVALTITTRLSGGKRG
jgi:sulfopyruvate decarboxylase alpha subunit